MTEVLPDRAIAYQVAAALLMLAASGLPARWVEGPLGKVSAALRNAGPNASDYAQIERGYYERISNLANRFDAERSRISAQPFDAGELAQTVPDAREYVLKPLLSTIHRGARWTTNRHGQRDRERTLSKSPGCFRIAVVGDSIASGWGVEDDQGFTRLLESELGRGNRPIEVLNFAVPGHAPGQRWEHFNKVGWDFAPDLVVFEGTTADLGWDERRIRVMVGRGLGFDAHVYADLIKRAGLQPGEPLESAKTKIKRIRDQVLPQIYQTIAADCQARGIPVVWLLLPRVGKPALASDRSRLAQLAQRAGLDRQIDLVDSFDGIDAARLAIAPNDFHPNAEGHAILAHRLKQAFSASDLLPTDTSREGGPR